MDPNACLREILEALETGDRETAIERLRDLADWLQTGGFMPDEACRVLADDVGGFMSAVIHDIDFARRDKP